MVYISFNPISSTISYWVLYSQKIHCFLLIQYKERVDKKHKDIIKWESKNERCLIKFVGFVNFCGPKDWEIISILILNFSVTLQYPVPQCLDRSLIFLKFYLVSNFFCCNSYLEIILHRIIYLGESYLF